MRKTISVLINARLQSTRISNKLVRPFAGTSLIDIALGKLDVMNFFAHRYLCVAEEPLRTLGKKYQNIEILDRDLDAVKPGYGNHKIIYAHYGRVESDFIFWLNPCHPLLSIDTVKRAVETFHNTDFNSYTAVVSTKEWLFDINGNPVTNEDHSTLSTNHSPEFYKATHSFHIFNKAFFLKRFNVWAMERDDPYLVKIPEEENFDCDTPVQFETAQAVYKIRADMVDQRID